MELLIIAAIILTIILLVKLRKMKDNTEEESENSNVGEKDYEAEREKIINYIKANGLDKSLRTLYDIQLFVLTFPKVKEVTVYRDKSGIDNVVVNTITNVSKKESSEMEKEIYLETLKRKTSEYNREIRVYVNYKVFRNEAEGEVEFLDTVEFANTISKRQ